METGGVLQQGGAADRLRQEVRAAVGKQQYYSREATEAYWFSRSAPMSSMSALDEALTHDLS